MSSFTSYSISILLQYVNNSLVWDSCRSWFLNQTWPSSPWSLLSDERKSCCNETFLWWLTVILMAGYECNYVRGDSSIWLRISASRPHSGVEIKIVALWNHLSPQRLHRPRIHRTTTLAKGVNRQQKYCSMCSERNNRAETFKSSCF